MHFRADWTHVVFIHYRMPPVALAGQVPFELDLHDGLAFVSLVAFSLSKMRLNVCPALTAAILRPLSGHQFLNVRTYVRVGEMKGIVFLAEWLNCPPAVPLGGFSYGLPYRAGKIGYEHLDPKALRGSVREGSRVLRYEGAAGSSAVGQEFLLERYVAFTAWRNWRRYFRIEHTPWPATTAEIAVTEDSLLRQTGSWIDRAERASAHSSPGVCDVAMGFPRFLS